MGMAVLVVALPVAIAWAATVGAVEVGLWQIVKIVAARLGFPVAGDAGLELAAAVVWDIRMPRILMAVLVGAALSVAGACMQGLFRNPLADPGLIGVSSGGALGAVIGIVAVGGSALGGGLLGTWLVPSSAMAGGVLVTFVVYALSNIRGRTHVTIMLLTGIAMNALSGAVIGGALYVASNDELRRFVFWTLGSLSTASWSSLGVTALFVAGPLLIIPGYARALNLFLVGEAEAYHLGIDTQRTKRTLIFASASMVGASVAACGMIGFVGLVVPHMVRLLMGPDHRSLLPASALLGALLTLAADVAARQIDPPAEVPIGIITALLGAPFFLALLQRRKHQSAF